LANWNCKKQKGPRKYKRELPEMQAVDKQKLPRQCIMSIPHRLPTQSHHIETKKASMRAAIYAAYASAY
jgi:hypothetical protein